MVQWVMSVDVTLMLDRWMLMIQWHVQQTAVSIAADPSKDVLEWMKDWGNQFNKAASKASFLEHMQALSKMEPCIVSHLESFEPKMTSSHKDYERVIKNFLDLKFPGRFASYREYQSATAFRNRMLEYNLWDAFIAWANQNVNFQQAGDLENSNIFKILNVVSRRLLAFAPSPKGAETVKENQQITEYSWADLCMSALKFCLPCANPRADQWVIPFCLSKAADLDKDPRLMTSAKLPELSTCRLFPSLSLSLDLSVCLGVIDL